MLNDRQRVHCWFPLLMSLILYTNRLIVGESYIISVTEHTKGPLYRHVGLYSKGLSFNFEGGATEQFLGCFSIYFSKYIWDSGSRNPIAQALK